jgi:DNA-binding XRE family transcriptional regulator
MEREKKERLQARGWKVGSAADFLDLDPEEALLVDIKARLAVALGQLRQERKLTQTALAQRLGSSQSRVAKMEAGDRSVSLELLFRSLLSLGATRQELAKVIGRK